MQGRSWMAALTLAAASALIPASSPADEPATPPPAPKVEAKPQAVRLDLWIRGLTGEGCEVDIKPGHPGCKFRPASRHVGPDGKLSLEFKDVEVLSADRDCTFAITIREPGQDERTVFRGLRIGATAAGKARLAVLPCFLSSNSRLAKAGDGATTKR